MRFKIRDWNFLRINYQVVTQRSTFMHSKSFSIYRIHSFHCHSIYSFNTFKIHVEVCLIPRSKLSDNPVSGSVSALVTLPASESVSESKVLISSLSESAYEFLIQVSYLFESNFWFVTSPCPPISTKIILAQELILRHRLNQSLKFGKLSMFWIMFPEATDSFLMISNVMTYFELRYGTCWMFYENIHDSSKNSFVYEIIVIFLYKNIIFECIKFYFRIRNYEQNLKMCFGHLTN